MAAEGEVVDEQETEAKAKGEGGKQNKDLDTVTDYVEAREMARACPCACHPVLAPARRARRGHRVAAPRAHAPCARSRR